MFPIRNLITDSNHLIMIIMTCHQHRYPWSFLTTPPHCSSLLAGPLGYIPYHHRAAVCSFELVVLLFLGHMRGSIGVHHLWARPASQVVSCMSASSILDSFRDGRLVAVKLGALWSVASRNCSKLLAAFLCSCRLAFPPSV